MQLRLLTALLLSTQLYPTTYAGGHEHSSYAVAWTRTVDIRGGDDAYKQGLAYASRIQKLTKSHGKEMKISMSMSGNPYQIPFYTENTSMDKIVQEGTKLQATTEWKSLMKEIENSGVFGRTYDTWQYVEK